MDEGLNELNEVSFECCSALNIYFLVLVKRRVNSDKDTLEFNFMREARFQKREGEARDGYAKRL